MSITDRFALLVAWLKGEPVVTRVIGALAVSWLAQAGIHLDAQTTMAVATVAGAVAAWAARRKTVTHRKAKQVAAESYIAGKTKQARPSI